MTYYRSFIKQGVLINLHCVKLVHRPTLSRCLVASNGVQALPLPKGFDKTHNADR